jgi:hypothetical protein
MLLFRRSLSVRIFSHLGALLGSAITVALVAGCSGGMQSPASNSQASTLGVAAQQIETSALVPGTRLSVLPPNMRLAGIGSKRRTPFVNIGAITAAQGNQTIISDAFSSTVTVWGGAGQLNAILFNGIAAAPTGLTTDAAHSLYVSEEGYGDVAVYPMPYTSISLTLDDADEKTQGVAVSKAGVVGVTNYLTSAYAAGSVYFYAKGSTSSCAVVQDPNWVTFYFDAFDASGNLFIDGQDSFGDTLVGEITGGCQAKSITTLSVNNTISIPGGVQVYQGKILIGDPQNLAVYTYAAPHNGSLGSPTSTTTLAGATYPLTFVMMDGNQALWTADFNATQGFAGKYGYPNGVFGKSITENLLPVGVAVNPAARP